MNYEDNGLAVKRLIDEYKLHGNLLIAVDFDNTVYDYHGTGLNMGHTINLVKKAHSLGLSIMCFTANADHELVRKYWEENLGIEDIMINVSHLDHLFKGRKPFYSHLLDDRAGLGSACVILSSLLNYIEGNQNV